jgi:2-keto-4-pentenoate hydratase/2-oxohepta-3-ene-1,7-dioic acid hydratase in catechol pathway
MMEAIHMGRERAVALLSGVEKDATDWLPEDTITYAPAVDDPEKILCIGTNYRDHIAEAHPDFIYPPIPNVFAKFRNTLAPHRGVVIRNRSSQKHDYEAEIAVIIGKTASDISREDALDYVFGYTLANDVSARDLQKAASQWTPGKSCDTFCPLGPCILTADCISHDAMHITGYKNGELRQSGYSRDMIFDIPEIVSFLSRCCTLQPGDVILTGTPSGVVFGKPKEQQDWLVAGDIISVHVDEIGTLTVTMADR